MTPERFARFKAALDRRQPDLTVLVEDVHKPHNVSALIRTCDAVGIPAVHAVSPGGDFHRHHMVSGGARKWVRTQAHPDIETAIAQLRREGFRVVAADLNLSALDYRDYDYTQPTALLLGSELAGVSRAAARLADERICVPMQGLAESLNVSVAAAVILYEAMRQREKAGCYARRRLDAACYRETLFEWCYPGVARICRAQGMPLPDLDADGFIVRPGLARSVRAVRAAAGKTARRTSGEAS
jgi:tRNA (guanosine-2'-O-)-methyltransferase